VVPESAAERLAAIRAQLPASTQLLAVSKGHPASAIRELAGLGQLSFGESRLQEAVAKQAELADLQSVDALALAERVARIAGEEGVCPKLLLQVKLRPDPAKGGFTPEDLRQAWPQLRALPGVQLVGLMTMAPLGLDAAQRRSLFGDCAALAQELGLGQLSMGMSGDWPEAAAAGSTWVRIGSALFGSKPLSPPAWDAI
jgi:uncharacterized pyridoxal phosphate-containing UPF0001 family protein